MPYYTAPFYTAGVTLLAVALYAFLATRVARARRQFDVRLPAITGNPEFERVFRVHMNTLEWMPQFLIPLWLCAFYLSDIAAACLGLVWIAGRILYYVGYRKAVEKRFPGFMVQALACIALFFCAIAGLVMHVPNG
jgi:glutathione S-transferase